MTLEEMKQAWQEVDRRLTVLEEKNEQLTNLLRNGKRRTALERLIVNYKRFIGLGSVFALLGVMLFYESYLYGEYHRWLMGGYVVMMLVVTVESYWFYKGLSAIDVMTMDVAQVNRMVLYYRKRDLRCMMVQAPLAFLFVGMVIALNMDKEYLVYGAVSGTIVGLAFGLRALKKKLADYKALVSED